jgi:hypothetical protein
MDIVLSPELPDESSVARVQAVEVAVVGANQQPVTNDHRRGLDFTARSKCPKSFSIACADCMNQPRQVSNVDRAVGHRGRGLTYTILYLVTPLYLSVRKVHRKQIARLRANVDRGIGNGS